jgi:hypothetical protein
MNVLSSRFVKRRAPSGGLEPLTFGFVIGVVVRIASVALHSTLAERAIDCRR